MRQICPCLARAAHTRHHAGHGSMCKRKLQRSRRDRDAVELANRFDPARAFHDVGFGFDVEKGGSCFCAGCQNSGIEDTAPLKHPKPPLPPEIGRFRQVTDVTWDPAGNTYISDGYINSRVAKADKNGNWIKSWG